MGLRPVSIPHIYVLLAPYVCRAQHKCLQLLLSSDGLCARVCVLAQKTARQIALLLTATFNAVGILEYVIWSPAVDNFDGNMLGTQLASLCYVLLQAYVAIRGSPEGAVSAHNG